MTARIRRSLSVLVAAALVLSALPAPAEAGCETPIDDSNRPNIVLFVVDDLGWETLPYFTGAVKDPTQPLAYEVWRADLNRFTARALRDPAALASTWVESIDQQTNPAVYEIGGTGDDSCDAEWPGGVKPTDCDPKTDIIANSGFARLAKGVVFSRFYSASAVCGPSRATIFSGRNAKARGGTRAHNAFAYGHGLHARYATIAEYLRQGCEDAPCFGQRVQDPAYPNDPERTVCVFPDAASPPEPDAIAPCYVTALVGKGNGLESGRLTNPGTSSGSSHGIDEFFGFLPANRQHFATNAFACKMPAGTEGMGGVELCPNKTERSPKHPKTFYPAPDNPGPTVDQSRERYCGRDDGWTIDTGCFFQDRVFRDVALDFIQRHKDDKFFLTVSFHGVHDTVKAPKRTVDHYTDPAARIPGDAPSYWAMLEEIDASIGRVLDKLEDIEAEGGATARKTVVFFTSDNGPPGTLTTSGFPQLNGGKGSTFERGVRVGLLARACNDSSNRYFDGEVAGHADLFPTIADFAGFGLGAHFGEEQTLGGDCDSGTEACTVHGKSLYDLINGTSSTGPRDHVVAGFGRSHSIMSRRGWGPANKDKVCGHIADIDHPGPVDEADLPTEGGMPFIASSCLPCGDADDCAGQVCRVLGTACVVENTGYCRQTPDVVCTTDKNCEPGGVKNGPCMYEVAELKLRAFRLKGHNFPCTGDLKNVDSPAIQCTSCVDASWKLRLRDGQVRQLYDLSTNPEEQPSLNCAGSPDLFDVEGELITGLNEEIDPPNAPVRAKTWTQAPATPTAPPTPTSPS